MHLRDFHRTRDWDQLYEVFSTALLTGADLHVNHLQSHMGSFTDEALDLIDRAGGVSVTTECYPYTAASTFIQSALFDDWESRPDETFQRYEWPPTGERLTRETFAKYRQQGGVIIMHTRDEARQEAAVQTCLAHPLPMIASDGAWDGGHTPARSRHQHPRARLATSARRVS